MAWLASDFLLELRRAVGIASSSSASPEGLTDPELLPTIDREIQLSLVPLLLKAREEFLVLKSSVPVTGATTRVRIPPRAIAGQLRDIRQTVNGMDRPLTRYQPEEKATLFPGVNAAGALVGYYLEGEWIVLLGAPLTSQTLDIYYLARPGRLTVDPLTFRQIIATGTAPLWTVNWSSAWTPVPALDVVRGDGTGLSTIFTDAVAAGMISGNTQVNLGFDGTANGDWLTYSNTSPVIPLPVELHSLLLSRATCALLRQLGKYDAASAEEKTADRLEHVAVGLLSPRVQSQSKVVVGTFHWRSRRRGGGRVW